MSGTSSVGGPGVYEAGDQRNYKDEEINTAERFKEGKPNSHLANDSSIYTPCAHAFSSSTFYACVGLIVFTEDERSIANKLAREEKRAKEPEPRSLEAEQIAQDATLPVSLRARDA